MGKAHQSLRQRAAKHRQHNQDSTADLIMGPYYGNPTQGSYEHRPGTANPLQAELERSHFGTQGLRRIHPMGALLTGKGQSHSVPLHKEYPRP